MTLIVSSGRAERSSPREWGGPRIRRQHRSLVRGFETRVTPRMKPDDSGVDGPGEYPGVKVARQLERSTRLGIERPDERAGVVRDIVRDAPSAQGSCTALAEWMLGEEYRQRTKTVRDARNKLRTVKVDTSERQRRAADTAVRRYYGKGGVPSRPTRASMFERAERTANVATITHLDVLRFSRESGMSYQEARDYLVARRNSALAERTAAKSSQSKSGQQAPRLKVKMIMCDECGVTVRKSAGCFCDDASSHMVYLSDGTKVAVDYWLADD